MFPEAFLIGFGATFLLVVVAKVMGKKIPFTPMAFGIGMFLGLGLAVWLAVGGIARLFVKGNAPKKEHSGLLVATGLMGGEGVAGFTAALLLVLGVSSTLAYHSLIGLFLGVLLVSALVFWFKKKAS